MGRRTARSVAVVGPPDASAARIARRVGSASAPKTCSATASVSGSASGGIGSRVSGGVEVVDQLAELARPALGVAAVRLLVGVVGELGEAGLDHGEPRAGTDRFERELDIG